MELYRRLFDFATKVGCLEGYLYRREEVDRACLPNWVGNVRRMFRELPPEVRSSIAPSLRPVVERALREGRRHMNAATAALLEELLRDLR